MAKRMYIVTYDVPFLTSLEKKKAIADAVKASGGAWWHYLTWTWLVVSDKTANDIATSITPHVRDAKGRLLVMEVAVSNRQGLLPAKGWAWIKTWSNRFRGLAG